MTTINKLLIANRGEIAVRIIRTAREMGIRTVAVFSEADAHSMHLSQADEAVCIGASEPLASYLKIDHLLAAAEQTGCDALHPGYGFLSERSEFSEACRAAGLNFVGPSPESMDLLGSKSAAKTLALAEGVPIVPGYFEPEASDQALRNAADGVGYPLLLKASAGGGGRGMRVVQDPTAFDLELKMAREEALKAFGDGAMMVEKLIEAPRHIEVQFLADRFGNVACLFERECSVQRRHQKLIEEGPSPWKPMPERWHAMRDAAQKLVRASRYEGAGTVEFIVDPSSEEFYFLEVNTRLQVEHGVTELICGLDLVNWQLRIASGEALGEAMIQKQFDRSNIRGHAIEVRIIAEDPQRGFLPSTGKILGWVEPQGPGIRVDSGFRAGDTVSPYYDSLLSKLIVHAETRELAVRKLREALLDFHILGVETNIGFLIEVIESDRFGRGELDTGMLKNHHHDVHQTVPKELGAILNSTLELHDHSLDNKDPSGAWDLADSFRLSIRQSS